MWNAHRRAFVVGVLGVTIWGVSRVMWYGTHIAWLCKVLRAPKAVSTLTSMLIWVSSHLTMMPVRSEIGACATGRLVGSAIAVSRTAGWRRCVAGRLIRLHCMIFAGKPRRAWAIHIECYPVFLCCGEVSTKSWKDSTFKESKSLP